MGVRIAGALILLLLVVNSCREAAPESNADPRPLTGLELSRQFKTLFPEAVDYVTYKDGRDDEPWWSWRAAQEVYRATV